jgi:hypothetical protein
MDGYAPDFSTYQVQYRPIESYDCNQMGGQKRTAKEKEGEKVLVVEDLINRHFHPGSEKMRRRFPTVGALREAMSRKPNTDPDNTRSFCRDHEMAMDLVEAKD